MKIKVKRLCPACTRADFREICICDEEIPDRQPPGWLRFLTVPLGGFLFVLGYPICFFFGVGLENRSRIRFFGALALLILLIGRLGAGPQLAGAAVLTAVALGCLELPV
ncbi:MAG: hypothetical protein R3F51_20750 [Cyanobacteriota/Melainabacteria group bacterium]